jgi:hypothetical protein
MWHQRLWLIDHGAALYFHHTPNPYLERSQDPFPMIKNHVLLPFATSLRDVDEKLTARLTPGVMRNIVDLIPDAWLENASLFGGPTQHRSAYLAYLLRRLELPHGFLEEAGRARSLHL